MKQFTDENPVAILGGGAVGKAIACDCALAGRKNVRLYDLPEYAGKSLVGIEKHGITFTGSQMNAIDFKREGAAYIDLVTDNLEQAVKGAGIVIVATPATGHPSFFEKLIPHLDDGMIVHIIPDNYGSLRLRKMMAESGCKKNIILGGWNCAPHGVRLAEQSPEKGAVLRIVNRFTLLKGAAFPMLDQTAFLESIRSLPAFDCAVKNNGIEQGDTILDVNFSNINPVLHIPTTILGVGVMENWGVIFGTDKRDYSIFAHAMCPSILKVQREFYREECAIADALGVGITCFQDSDFSTRESVLHTRFMGPGYGVGFDEICENQVGVGPDSVHHRFLTEDVPMCCCVYRHLSVLAGVNTPILDAFITLAGILTGNDYMNNNVTLADLGIQNLSVPELRSYLDTGKH